MGATETGGPGLQGTAGPTILTNPGIKNNYGAVKRSTRVIAGAAAGLVFGLLLGPRAVRPGAQTAGQEPPPREVQKPNYDYMNSFRSTHPLGLKDDPAARRMLGQGPVAWAIRSGSRHVLD